MEDRSIVPPIVDGRNMVVIRRNPGADLRFEAMAGAERQLVASGEPRCAPGRRRRVDLFFWADMPRRTATDEEATCA
ncbi:hypothetical protein ACFW93_44475 [Streptomyces canus]|uniref:hypothetical protein n=1 Tax=Streptomyces canus TaxID=58343 RepID=UPI00367AE457